MRFHPIIGLMILTLSLEGRSNSKDIEVPESTFDLAAHCASSLAALPGTYDKTKLSDACDTVKTLPECKSVNDEVIFHFDSIAKKETAKRVLVIGVIHGDEPEGGSVTRRWMERLANINARNSWRIVPLANPDGWHAKTRMNANGVDLNRNFPSEDWERLAHKYWSERKNKDPRRNPGKAPGSEPETQCIMKHIADFKPDFIVAVHTPYGVLDFDGPKISQPRFKSLPWVSLGTFPGSLGRYMWKDQKVPVLTVELKNDDLLKKIDAIDDLQDLAGTTAIRSTNISSILKKGPDTKQN
ncbi:MAG: DUF2817 domain-containing protein [Pseudobacteriovorax sp.]|nr:DUF2817 domain-containing protein [Pseudobacteriovorax sp.]